MLQLRSMRSHYSTLICTLSFSFLCVHVVPAPTPTSISEIPLQTTERISEIPLQTTERNVSHQTSDTEVLTHDGSNNSNQGFVADNTTRTGEENITTPSSASKLQTGSDSLNVTWSDLNDFQSNATVNGQDKPSPIPADSSQQRGNENGDEIGPDAQRWTNYDIDMDISLESDDDLVLVKWTFPSNFTEITGFLVTYNNEDNKESFDSSKLGTQVRSLVLHAPHEEDTYEVCVEALVNTTAVKTACTELSSKASLGKIIAGTLAGVVFLIPCMAALVWILRKDSYMSKDEDMDEADQISKKSLIEKDLGSEGKAKNQSKNETQNKKRIDEVVKTEEPDTVVSTTSKSSPNVFQKHSSRDKGHDNPVMTTVNEAETKDTSPSPSITRL